MSQYSAIKAATNAYIKSNGMREITGAILNSVMIATINALGKYYQFAGVADRDTDPGSPDENVIYITGTTGTYVNFGGIVVNAGEMALLKWDGTWTKQVIKIIPESTSQLLNDSGFINNAVGNLINYYLKSETYTKGQVDDLIAAVHQFEFVVADTLPTASADTMYKIYLIPAGDSEEDNYKDEYVTILEEGVYSWEKIGSTAVDLSDYPTNEQMAQAIDDAIAAYISSINASVDSNVGTPSVDVSYSSGVLTLAFHNLKGVQGDQGVPGPPGVTSVEASVDNNTGIPSVEASVNAGVLTLTFHNLKGLQGDTGSSVAYPFTLVNNTTTDDPLQALTAAMGKYLQDQVSQLEAEKADKDTVRANMMTIRAKQALLAVFNKVAFAFPDVSAEMDELENSLFNLDEIVGIEATYTQGDTVVYDQGVNTLDELKDNLIVKAVYGDGTKVPVQSYTLSGDITVAGTDTVSVYFLGFIDTFDVVVTHYTAQMVFKISTSDIASYKGTISRYDNNTKYCINDYGTSTNRRVFLKESGDVPLTNSSGTSIGKYPVPIPRNARKVTVSVTPSATLNIGIATGLLNGTAYLYTTGSIFTGAEDGGITRTFTTSQFDKYRKGGWYLITLCTPDSSFTGNEPSECVITFE